MNLHEKYKHEAIYLLGSKEHTRCWANETGVAHRMSDRKLPSHERRIVRYGLKGSTDIIGFTVIVTMPVFLGVEIKTGKQVLRKEQMDFKRMLDRVNAIHLIHYGDKEKLLQDFEDARNRCRDIIRQYWIKSLSSSWNK